MVEPQSDRPSADEQIIEGAQEALAIVKGEQPAASLHWHGHDYVPKAELDRLKADLDQARQQADDAIMSNDAIHVIRKMLVEHGVPVAAFIDDHVASAIVQRDEARAERDEALRALHADPARGDKP